MLGKRSNVNGENEGFKHVSNDTVICLDNYYGIRQNKVIAVA